MTPERRTAMGSRSPAGGRNGEDTTRSSAHAARTGADTTRSGADMTRNGADTTRSGRRPRPPVRSPGASPLLRLIAVAVAIVVVATTSAILGNMLRAPEYAAEVEILYRADDPSGGRAERELATQQVIIQGRGVLQPVAAEAGLTVEDLQDKLSVEIVGSSDVLRLRVGDRDVAEAVALTESIADSYVQSWIDDADATASAVLLTPAYPLEGPISPGPLQAGAAGMIVGLLIAGVLVAVRLQREGRYQ